MKFLPVSFITLAPNLGRLLDVAEKSRPGIEDSSRGRRLCAAPCYIHTIAGIGKRSPRKLLHGAEPLFLPDTLCTPGLDTIALRGDRLHWAHIRNPNCIHVRRSARLAIVSIQAIPPLPAYTACADNILMLNTLQIGCAKNI